MSRTGLRLLFVLLVAIGATALVWSYRIDTLIAAERATATGLERAFGDVHVMLGDLKTAQAAYVATGQDPQHWAAVSAGLFARLDEALTRQNAETLAEGARAHYDAASAALGDLSQTDRRARDYASSDQLFLASDVVFVDAPVIHRKITAEVALARAAEASTKDARIAWLTQMRLVTNAAAIALGIVIGFLLLRGTGYVLTTTESSADSGILSLQETPARAATPAPVIPPVMPAPPPLPAASVINFTDVADLCVDFSRLTSGDEMPGLLERSSRVLQAKGLVLWVIDTSGTMLRPLLGHGYPDKVMARLGGLQVDSDNVTSLAYRSAEAQVIGGRGSEAYGALAVPLVTPTGCIGVLSAEIKRGRPDRETVSAAKMIAAQMATLAAPMGDNRAERAKA